MTTSLWLSLTDLGRIYGISAVHCGRLLSDAGVQLLVFPSMPALAVGGKAPPVLIFPDGGKGDRLIILSPAQGN